MTDISISVGDVFLIPANHNEQIEIYKVQTDVILYQYCNNNQIQQSMHIDLFKDLILKDGIIRCKNNEQIDIYESLISSLQG